ncbi:MAG: hypothetical protein KJ822_18735, partial [Proteobacteria bacterium]|nr:hypothetical protein [Pseudomonadota bacterium]
RFAAMRQVSRVSGDEIKAMAQACLAPEVVARTDGWQAFIEDFRTFCLTAPDILAAFPAFAEAGM